MLRTRAGGGSSPSRRGRASRRLAAPAHRIEGSASLSCRLGPLGMVVCDEDTTRWCGLMVSDGGPRRRRAAVVGGHRLGVQRSPREGFAGVDQVQVAALDGILGIELARAPADGAHARGTVLDHL